MNTDRINEIFGQIELLLKELQEVYVGADKQQAGNSKTNPIAKAHKSKKGIGPAKPILELVAQGFFNTHKIATEVQAELRKRALNIDKDVISVALMRLVRKGGLEREGIGTLKNPWKYKNK